MRLERLAQHEPRLRERALARVDEQQHTVDHRERALDLAAEVGVTGRVDDVEDHVAVANRRVLGEDRDALLALEVVRVHHPLVDVLVGAERAGLPQQGVDQRGLAVVDVGDDRNIAQIRARGHGDLRRGSLHATASAGLARFAGVTPRAIVNGSDGRIRAGVPDRHLVRRHRLRRRRRT